MRVIRGLFVTSNCQNENHGHITRYFPVDDFPRFLIPSKKSRTLNREPARAIIFYISSGNIAPQHQLVSWFRKEGIGGQ